MYRVVLFAFVTQVNLLKGTNSERVVSVIPNKTNWYDAEAICESCGGNLIEWNNNLERISIISNLPEIKGERFWIGNYKNANPKLLFEGLLYNCTFETDYESNLCSYENSGILKWQHRRWFDKSYWIMTSFNGTVVGSGAKFSTPVISDLSSRQLCLKFGYYVSDNVGLYVRLVHIMEKENVSINLWSEENSIGPKPLNQTLNILSDTPFKIIFESIRISGDSSSTKTYVAIDNVSVTAGRCTIDSDSQVDSICPVLVIKNGSKLLHMDRCNKSETYASLCETKEIVSEKQHCSFTAIESKFSTNPSENITTISSTTQMNTNISENKEQLQDVIIDQGLEVFQVATGLLSALSVGLFAVLMFVLWKYKRLGALKRKHVPKHKNCISVSNINYDTASTRNDDINQGKTTKVNGNKARSQVLASAVPSVAPNRKDDFKYSSIEIHNENNPYQNAALEIDGDDVYTESKEGDYDKIGSTEKRRKYSNMTGDPTYDHAAAVDSFNNGDYDTTVHHKNSCGRNDSSYPVLEKQDNKRSSDIYDHAV